MKWLFRVLPICGVLVLSTARTAEPAKQGPASPQANHLAGEALFQKQIQPLLKQKCLGCHGEGETLEGGLDLRTRATLLRGGDSGPVVVPGASAKSRLYQAVARTGELKMPPQARSRLTPAEVAAVRAWIDAGLPWETVAAPRTSSWESKQEDVWALQPVRRYPVPALGTDSALVKTSIDAFITQRLREKGLGAAPPAARVTFLRRATFDLIGLPPTPEEIDAFAHDPSPNAFDKVLDRLLASPHYGERWGRHWLDVVRYADTSGYANDYERPNAWRYRDYVIRSFNEDKPYDRFLVEQIAGDELDSGDPNLRIATGFLRMGPWEHTGMSVATVTRQLFLDDVTNAVGISFLGLTLGCARCHDHKFDPIPTRDYYRFQALFAPAQFEEPKTPFLPCENTAGFAEAQATLRERMRLNEARLREIEVKAQRALQDLLKKHAAKTVSDLPVQIRPDKWYGLDAADLERQRVYRKRLEYYDRELKRYQPQSFSVSSGGSAKKVPVPPVHVLIGGALTSPGEQVSPGVLTAVSFSNQAVSLKQGSSLPEKPTGQRLALARWIADPANPLTARVIVNRVWQYHFGTGLVETSNNFGKMGKRPTHPELLDWLASYFVEQGWSIKALHRLILRSAVYQQSGEHPSYQQLVKVDPRNRLLAYFPPRRLTAEELRDSILAVSGELSRAAGGPGTFPEINDDLARQPRQIMGTIAPTYEPSPKRSQRNRRTIYTFQMRNLPNPFLEVFNGPNLDISCERRDETTVTPQVFALFNSRFAHDQALMLAHRLEALSPDRAEQINHAFRLAFGRLPDERDRSLCSQHVEKALAHHRTVPPVKEEQPRQITRTHIAELTGTRFDFVEDWDPKHYEPNLRPSDVPPETRALAELCLAILNSNEFVYLH